MIATDLVRSKLADSRWADDAGIIAELVGQLLNSDLASDVNGDERAEYDESQDHESELIIAFDDADLHHITEAAERIEAELPELVMKLAQEAATHMLRRYRQQWRAYRPHELAALDTFRRNLEARWGGGFDRMHMLIELCRDIGTEFHDRARRSRAKRGGSLRHALGCLHVRALQVAAEIMTLMENGFADGAMARWRTLHEVVVVATVLADAGDALAELYLEHEIVEAKRALDQYRRCHEPLGYAPFAKREAAKIEKNFAAAIARHGAGFREPFGWASGHLRNPNPKFNHLEEWAGRAMMRSHYKMASYNVHASAKGIAHRLGSLGDRFHVIAGATNVGFVEPGQNMALSLAQISLLLLRGRWDADTIARWIAIMRLQGEIPSRLAAAEARIRREERAKRREVTRRRTRRAGREASTSPAAPSRQ